MAEVITFAQQKGGASKTTSSGVTAFLLAQDGFRVLAVDTDSQGNLTELLTNSEISAFRGSTVLEAMKNGDARPYIVKAENGVDVLPSDTLTALFSRWLYTEAPKGTELTLCLRKALEPVQDQYDVIVLDTPPALGENTMNAFACTDWLVTMFEPSRFCYAAMPEFFHVVELIKEVNPGIKGAGILRVLTDNRRSDMKNYNDLIADIYPDQVFETVINRKAETGRLGVDGLNTNNKEWKAGVAPYIPFIRELKHRCRLIKKS